MRIDQIMDLFKRVEFGSPRPCRVVILDNNGSDILRKMVLSEVDSTVLPTRLEVIYLSPQIWMMLLLNSLRYISRIKINGLKDHIFQMYLLSCIQHMNPVVVVTFIDNNRHYQALSRLYKKADFFYIVNGTRNSWDLKIDRKFSLTNLLCWGQQDIDNYRRFGHQVDCYYPVGPLISGYYKSNIGIRNPQIKYDICIVSQYRSEVMAGLVFPTFKKAIVLLDQYLKKFLDGKELSVCVATCSLKKADLLREVAYYQETYGGRVDIIEQNREHYSTYTAMDESKLIITIHSTAAFEAYSWGKRVLMCNLSGDPDNDMYILDDLMVRNQDYNEFENKLATILNMDDEEYRKLIRENRKYVVNYNPEKPAHLYIRELINNSLCNGGV